MVIRARHDSDISSIFVVQIFFFKIFFMSTFSLFKIFPPRILQAYDTKMSNYFY